MTKDLPAVIDIDYVNQLRKEMRFAEANAALETYRANVEKAKREALNDFNRTNRKKLKQVGICTACKNYDAVKGKAYCERCAMTVKRLYRARRDQNICVRCKINETDGKTLCTVCAEDAKSYCKKWRQKKNEAQ